MTRHTSSVISAIYGYVHIFLPYHSVIVTRRKRSSAPADSAVARKKRMEVLEPTTI